MPLTGFKELIRKLDSFIMDNIINNLKGYGILIEPILLSLLNYYILIPRYGIFEIIKNIIFFKFSSISVTDIIAVLTSLLLAIGFIYHVGFVIGIRKIHPNKGFGGGNSYTDMIIPHGAIFLLAFFMPLLFLSESGKSGLGWYIAINIFLIFVFGLVNEWIIQRFDARGIDREGER